MTESSKNTTGHFEDMQKSGYPSNTMAANVSKDTTHREVIDIEGIAKDIFMIQNMNLAYGITNSVEYSQVMFGLPSLFDVINNIERDETLLHMA